MKRAALVGAALLVLGLGTAARPAAQSKPLKPQHDGCVRQYYDRAAPKWLTIENNCPVDVIIFWFNTNGFVDPATGPTEAMTLKAGEHKTTAESSEKLGGAFHKLYICPSGYVPRDETGEGIIKGGAVTRYACVK